MNSGLETRRLRFSEQLHCNLFRDLEQIPWPLSFLGLGVGGLEVSWRDLQGPWDSEKMTWIRWETTVLC